VANPSMQPTWHKRKHETRSLNVYRTQVSSAVLMHASMSWSSHALWNAWAQNEGGVCHFPPKIRSPLP